MHLQNAISLTNDELKKFAGKGRVVIFLKNDLMVRLFSYIGEVVDENSELYKKHKAGFDFNYMAYHPETKKAIALLYNHRYKVYAPLNKGYFQAEFPDGVPEELRIDRMVLMTVQISKRKKEQKNV